MTHGGPSSQLLCLVLFSDSSVHVLEPRTGGVVAAWVCGDRECSAIGTAGNAVCVAKTGTRTLSLFRVEAGMVERCWTSPMDTAHTAEVTAIVVTRDRVFTAAGPEVRCFQTREAVGHNADPASATATSASTSQHKHTGMGPDPNAQSSRRKRPVEDDGAAGQLLWVSWAVDRHVEDITVLVLVGGTMLASGDASGAVKCWHQESGALLWTTQAQRASAVSFMSVVSEQRGEAVMLVCGDRRGGVVALSGDGAVVWRRDVAAAMSLSLSRAQDRPFSKDHSPEGVTRKSLRAPEETGAGIDPRGFDRVAGPTDRPLAGVAVTSRCVLVSEHADVCVALGSQTGGVLGHAVHGSSPEGGMGPTGRACSAHRTSRFVVVVYEHGLAVWSWDDRRAATDAATDATHVDMGDAVVFTPVCGYLRSPEVANARFLDAKVAGAYLYATVADGSVLAVDLNTAALCWHSEKVMVAARGLEVMNNLIFSGSMQGLTTLNRYKFQTYGLEIVHHVEQEKLKRDVFAREYTPPLLMVFDSRTHKFLYIPSVESSRPHITCVSCPLQWC